MSGHSASSASSARADELDKFNRLADQWWDEEGPFGALHAVNPLRMEFIAEHAVIEDARVLDVGCGGGILSEALALAGAEVTALDLATDGLDAARHHAQAQDLAIDYRLADIIDFAAENPGKFDCITCMEMLEHVDEPARIVQALGTAVKPGGWVFLSTLNRNPKSWLLGIAAAEYLLKLVPPGTHEHKRFIKPSELTLMARRARLTPRALCGITYNPLTRHYALNPHDLDVNYLLACQKDE
ncbi:bifunctional 3-demethylubiquinol 3-O-methyltransferase/2-polyprenyl-6-hydroxyphenol methylase [Halothiobacillus diazotrophicus]|uniref:Ubiquinone biosynthesis O-methyltransferase n=1 Tax=Halothiobacillus diazotrophicus TaxID=1860122 RepID=A0A191ZFX3_9GAMM|nr:bifunctional 2-polyprenyl-6-hydroxyphenol methylase/3-demethylubiquinol 3-O-methyltransferase UbiG [Halothiobacillus diazotrophicus]ANJ66768.1 bifunctional 3-demethylubiquinol 3-O-methyltransferase/2-polyprenyl-6-hydroxyphenol methylase [Halothiobacillus diazotrophicus]